MQTPEPYQRVEVLIDGHWRPAVFYAADSIYGGPEQDENWWFDYFELENGSTIPEDITRTAKLPPWRPHAG
jgi:hypothetical protein